MFSLLRRALLSLIVSGAAGVPLLAQQVPSNDVAQLRPGDVLRITVWENEKMSGEFEVAPDSSLRHPVYNQLKVGGIPVTELHQRVDGFLRRYQRDPQIEVEPLLRVTVMGQVRNPNVYSLPPEATVADALAQAGGATSMARLDGVVVTRGGRDMRVDLTRPEHERAAMTVRSGDRIEVRERKHILRDYIGPLASVAASIVSIIAVSRR